MTPRIAIIQARMTSTRLPGKSLMSLAGRPMLAHVVERVRRVAGLDAVWVATTNDGSEAPLVAAARAMGVPVHCGHVDDVLSRYAAIAAETGASVVMRITADCPLLDPDVSARVLARFDEGGCDYASNVVRRTYPRGLDTEVFSASVLRQAAAEATDPMDREHVTRFFYTHPERFRLCHVEGDVDRSRLRWTVDTPEDFRFVSEVVARLPEGPAGYPMASTLAVLDAEPRLGAINANIQQKPV